MVMTPSRWAAVSWVPAWCSSSRTLAAQPLCDSTKAFIRSEKPSAFLAQVEGQPAGQQGLQAGWGAVPDGSHQDAPQRERFLC